MPTYIFECSNCNYTKEDFVSISFPKISICPKCNKNTLIRCIGTGSGFVFKGEGFYENDKKLKDAIKDNEMMNQERDQRNLEDSDY